MKLVFILVGLVSCTAVGQMPVSMRKLPDSGQTNSFESTFGEDSDYLIFAMGYEMVNSQIVLDTVTGLMWQRTDGGEMTFEEALNYADTSTLGGFINWRLPLAKEAMSILNLNNSNPALDNSAFTTTTAEYWWTSEVQTNNANKVWVTNAGGGIGNHPKNETISAGGNKRFHARLVRDVVSSNANENQWELTTINNVAMVKDTLARLMWPANLLSDSLNFLEAISFCESANTAGFNDWRLPNIKELQTIVNLGHTNPCFSGNDFGIATVKLWSSTTLANHTDESWYLDTQYGITTYAPKTKRLYFLPVRNYSEETSAITTMNEFGVGFYPNPISGTKLHVKLTNNTAYSYTICNLLGETMSTGSLVGREIDTTHLPAGSYVVQVWNSTNKWSSLVVKL